jgi:hypothetical protein
VAGQSFGGPPKATSRESGIGFRSPVSTPRGAIRAGLHIDTKLALVKLSEVAEAAGSPKAYASDVRSGKWTPHVSTWGRFRSWLGP